MRLRLITLPEIVIHRGDNNHVEAGRGEQAEQDDLGHRPFVESKGWYLVRVSQTARLAVKSLEARGNNLAEFRMKASSEET